MPAPSKEKTKPQWLMREWAISFLALLGAIAGIVVVQVNLESFSYGFVFLVVLYPAAFVLFFLFLARTFGVIMLAIFPEKSAGSLEIDAEKIVLSMDNNTVCAIYLKDIDRIILSEKFNGLYINSKNGQDSYRLPLSYADIEQRIDAINSPPIFKKEGQLIEGNSPDLGPHKNLEGIKTSYRQYRAKGGGYEREIDSAHGAKTIYYTKL
ncbi:MAG: hypothetical protein HY544_02915 [Candidatus Diapherotrites archaeon]|uniref:Uncharacterized protein n=1 Tax=Candidatus Iainarchaeum sp. TaxID=3101447 RepID=A0A8T3YNN4_9ARCH|nr:hypothetical protein [Candidatus Diapherotrites archaeon]